MADRTGERRCPRQHKDGAKHALDEYTDGSGWACPGLAPDGSACGYEEPGESFLAAIQLLEEALHLRRNGERAPGGTETWRDWERRAGEFLRDVTAAPGGECAP